MADGDHHSAPPIRLMNFVSEQHLEEAKKTRGARVEDGTAQRDRTLYEVLKENKDKKDAEFNERFKHRPPKALDEDETEFLDNLEMSKREYEKQVADEEAQELQRFQAAVEAQSSAVFEPKEIPSAPTVQDEKLPKKKHSSPHPSGLVIKVMPQAKKAKRDHANSEATACVPETPDGDKLNTPISMDVSSVVRTGPDPVSVVNSTGCLVSYSDGSDDEE